LFLDPINIAQNHGETVNELVSIISEEVHYGGQIIHNNKYQDGSPKKVMNDRLFRQKFPDFEFTSLQIGISKTIEYYWTLL
jgi:hypothetical protein